MNLTSTVPLPSPRNPVETVKSVEIHCLDDGFIAFHTQDHLGFAGVCGGLDGQPPPIFVQVIALVLTVLESTVIWALGCCLADPSASLEQLVMAMPAAATATAVATIKRLCMLQPRPTLAGYASPGSQYGRAKKPSRVWILAIAGPRRGPDATPNRS